MPFFAVGVRVIELKPCPFCGSKDVGFGTELPQFGGDALRFVICNCCGSRTKICRSKKDAEDIWNRRENDG